MVQAMRFFTITIDEVITINNATWLLVTVYYIYKFASQSSVATPKYVEEGATLNNYTKVIAKMVIGIPRVVITNHMVVFGACM
jgi:hypothetical protein